MAAIKNIIKGVSTIVGEILVVGGALGTTYVLGFLKGAEVKPQVKEAVDILDKKLKAVVEEPETTEEPAEENSEPEFEEAEESPAPTIEVTHNQAED